MSVFVMGESELAKVGVGLLSLEKLGVVGVGLCKGWVEPFDVAEKLAALHEATVAAYEAEYEGRHGQPQGATALEIMREIGRLLGIRDEPIAGSIQGQYVWEFEDKSSVHDRAWRYIKNTPGAVKEARRAGWSLVYNALDNSGESYMSPEVKEIALYVCQALLVVED